MAVLKIWDGTAFVSVLADATDHGGLVGLGDDDHNIYLLAAGTRVLTADWDAGSVEIRAQTFESDVVTGTAPLIVASTTLVANLNADRLDSIEAVEFLQRDGSGPLTADWDAGSFEIRAQTFESDVITGTAPLVIASTTVVANLNVDQVDGKDETAFALLAGRSTGQTLIGGTASGEDLTLQSTSHATKGSIFFGAAGNSQYDEVNDRLGIRVTPLFPLHIEVDDTSNVAAFGRVQSVTGGAQFLISKARGTIGSELVGVDGDLIGAFAFRQYDGDQYHGAVSFQAFIDGTPSDNVAPGGFKWLTNPGGETQTERMRLTAIGNVTIGVNPGEPGTGTIGLFFGDGTAPSSLATNTAGVYANDVSGTVEMFAIDEAGNSAQLSPHNFDLFDPDDIDEYPWSYFARNDYLGVEIGINFARLVRLIEQQTGQQLIHIRQTSTRNDWVDDQEFHMRYRMDQYERWENNPRENDDGEEILPPVLPEVKTPPTWLEKRLKKKGLLNTSKAMALKRELVQWQAARNL